MNDPEFDPANTTDGWPYDPHEPIRYASPRNGAAPSNSTPPFGEEALMNDPEPGQSADADDETASEHGFEPTPDHAGGWPYDPPERSHGASPRNGAAPVDNTRPFGEWHHDDTFIDMPDRYDIPRNLEPPTGWTGGGLDTPGWGGPGTYVPGQEDRPPWGDPSLDPHERYHYPAPPDDYYQSDPYPTAPLPPESPRRGRRTAVRPLTVAALALVIVAAGAGGALLRNGTIRLSPSASPQTGVTSGLGTAAGAGRTKASAQPDAEQPPAISKADAENVVANYSQVNNKANAAYSNSLLGTIEGGSSYTMDTGAYRFALGQSSRAAYVPFQLADATYYIPRLPQNSYPRWFAVKGTYSTIADGKNLSTAYLVFAQDSAGAPWKDVIEPDILPGQTPPQIALDTSGYAQSVAPDATRLNVAPDKIGQITAEWLDQVASNKSDSVIKDESGNLTDLQDEVFWRSGQGGTQMDATDAHSAPAGQVFALKTASGGALVFYTTAARLTLTPANGDAIGGLNIPGYYTPANSTGLTSATVGYVEQFATYIPPAGNSDRDVVAEISSIASRG